MKLDLRDQVSEQGQYTIISMLTSFLSISLFPPNFCRLLYLTTSTDSIQVARKKMLEFIVEDEVIETEIEELVLEV